MRNEYAMDWLASFLRTQSLLRCYKKIDPLMPLTINLFCFSCMTRIGLIALIPWLSFMGHCLEWIIMNF